MATDTYIVGRKQYQRPQALCLSEGPGVELNGFLVPEGEEFVDFLVLSDHNRSAINMAPERIGERKRAINGRMRSYWIADKLSISTSWDKIPSRAWPGESQIDEFSGINGGSYFDHYTVDGGAGGNEMIEWYKYHPDSFWVFLAYDRYPNVGAFDKLNRYNEQIEVFFADFSYDIVVRGGTNMDLWNIDMKLEEA